MKCLYILRRDLRYKDNTTLNEIITNHNINEILTIFNFDPIQIEQTKNKYFNHNTVQFMIESLLDLKIRPKFTYNNIITTLDNIYKLWPFDILGFNKDYTSFSIKRDLEIKLWAENKGIIFISKDDVLLYEYNYIRNKSNNVYQKFTPFYNEAVKEIHTKNIRSPINKEKEIIKLIQKCFNNITTLNNLFLKDEELHNFYVKNDNLAFHGGYTNFKKLKFKNIAKYDEMRDYPEHETTNLSAYLKFGIVSIRKIYYKFINYPDFIRQLFWREFYYNLGLFSIDHKYDKINWINNKTDFNKWKNGQTGYEIIDAGMNELNISGHMHNRVRMIVASYLVKNLKIDWRKGEKYFAQKLIDYDPIQNNRNWCYIASVTPESQPIFRVFNPERQLLKFDKDKKYINKWLNN